MIGRYLSPTVDLVFKKLFGTVANKDLTISFLNSVLNLPEEEQLVDVVFNDPNNHLDSMLQKHSIVDACPSKPRSRQAQGEVWVRCTDKRGRQFIIEMQNDNYHDFAQRAQYYGACGISSQLKVAEEYGVLLPVVFVGIVSFTLFPRHKRYLTSHVTLDKKDLRCDLDLMQYHFIELPKFNKQEDQLETLIDKWIYFIKCAGDIKTAPEELSKNKTFAHAFQVLTQSTWTEKEMALYQMQIDARRVELGVLATAKNEGIEQGRAEGRHEGRQAGRYEIARNMLAAGLAFDIVAKTTGLSLHEVNEINKKI